MSSEDSILIYDTTLRDGTQGLGLSFSSLDKIRVAEKLDEFGVDYIEGGWPGSNPKDVEFFAEAKKKSWKKAKIAAFELDVVRNTNRREMKSKIRRAKTIMELTAYVGAIIALENMDGEKGTN